MEHSIDIFCGDPIEVGSEKAFLARLSEELKLRGQWAVVMANFFPPKRPTQVDFLVATPACACHVELKALNRPVVGGLNGPWHLVAPNGTRTALDGRQNPYRQALNCKYAISDEMHLFARRSGLPSLGPRQKYYQHIESVVCIYPHMAAGSNVHSDNRVRVVGFDGLLGLLRSSSCSPQWGRDRWIEFAKHMGLVRSKDYKETERESVARLERLQAYRLGFERFYSDQPQLVRTRLTHDSSTFSSAQLFESPPKTNLNLVGPSGAGKTILALHLARDLARKGWVPLHLRAREYDGDWSRLLDRSVAHLHDGPAMSLLEAANATGTRMLLLVDGLNECRATHVETLVRDLQAAVMKYPAIVCVTTQTEDQIPQALRGSLLHFAELSSEERLEVLGAYVERSLPTEPERFVEPFSTPFEVSLAAKTLEDLPAQPTRSDLLSAYVERRCASSNLPNVSRLILRQLAAIMHEELASSLRVAEFLHAAHSWVGTDLELTAAIDEALGTGLLEVRQGTVAFKHEMFERFFQAEALSLNDRREKDLPTLLVAPRNRDLGEFVIAQETDPATVRECLQRLASAEAIQDALSGRWGTLAARVAQAECDQVLLRARRACAHVRITAEGDTALASYTVANQPKWSQADRAIMRALGASMSRPDILAAVRALVRQTETACLAQIAAQKAGGKVTAQDRGSLFAWLYVLQGPTHSLPVSTIMNAYERTRYMRTAQADPADLLFPVEDCKTAGELLLLCELSKRLQRPDGAALESLLKRCWATGIYHLRLEVLETIQSHSQTLAGGARRSIAG